METWMLWALAFGAVVGIALALRTRARSVDPDELGVTLGEEITMSGPEFLEMLEAQGPYVVPDGRVDVSVVLPGEIQPLDRFHRFEEPLLEVLGEDAELLSGGTFMEEGEDGTTKTVADFSVQAKDREDIVDLVRATLQRAEAPAGSTFTLTRGEEQDESYDVYAS